MSKAEVPSKSIAVCAVIAVEGDVVSVLAVTAVPPGTRVVFTMPPGTGDAHEFNGKVVTVTREPGGKALLRIKLTNSSKRALEELRAASTATAG
jgi:hypothetical protein